MGRTADGSTAVRRTLERALDPSATDECPVCGTRLDPGEGIWISSGGTVRRFRGPQCAVLYVSDPDLYNGGPRAGRRDDR